MKIVLLIPLLIMLLFNMLYVDLSLETKRADVVLYNNSQYFELTINSFGESFELVYNK